MHDRVVQAQSLKLLNLVSSDRYVNMIGRSHVPQLIVESGESVQDTATVACSGDAVHPVAIVVNGLSRQDCCQSERDQGQQVKPEHCCNQDVVVPRDVIESLGIQHVLMLLLWPSPSLHRASLLPPIAIGCDRPSVVLVDLYVLSPPPFRHDRLNGKLKVLEAHAPMQFDIANIALMLSLCGSGPHLQTLLANQQRQLPLCRSCKVSEAMKLW